MKKLSVTFVLSLMLFAACSLNAPGVDKPLVEEVEIVSTNFETDKYTFEFPAGWLRIDSEISGSKVTLAKGGVEGVKFELHHPQMEVLGMPGYQECGVEEYTSKNGVRFSLGCNKYIDEAARKEIMLELGPDIDPENDRLVIGSVYDDTFFYTYNEKDHPSAKVDLRIVLDNIKPKK